MEMTDHVSTGVSGMACPQTMIEDEASLQHTHGSHTHAVVISMLVGIDVGWPIACVLQDVRGRDARKGDGSGSD